MLLHEPWNLLKVNTSELRAQAWLLAISRQHAALAKPSVQATSERTPDALIMNMRNRKRSLHRMQSTNESVRLAWRFDYSRDVLDVIGHSYKKIEKPLLN